MRKALLLLALALFGAVLSQQTASNIRCDPDQYRTALQADWGAQCRQANQNSEACLLNRNWNRCFSNGIQLGCQNRNTITFRNRPQQVGSDVIRAFLPQTQAAGVLTQSYVNPISQIESGRLGGNILSLRLSLGFDTCQRLAAGDVWSRGCFQLGNLRVCENPIGTPRGQLSLSEDDTQSDNTNPCLPFAGMTVSQILNQAETAIGGCCSQMQNDPRTCRPAALNRCLAYINQSFRNGNSLSQLQVNYFTRGQCPNNIAEQINKLEDRIVALETQSKEFITECRICFRETEGSSQCQGDRNTCSDWASVFSNNPSFTSPFRDDTDDRPGGCTYQWKLECRQNFRRS